MTYSNYSYLCSLEQREILRDLDRPKYGLQVIPYKSGTSFTCDGDYCVYYANHDALRREMLRYAPRDADAYGRYAQTLMRQCRFAASS